MTLAAHFSQRVGLSAAGSALWDGVKFLLRRRRTPEGADATDATTIEMHLHVGRSRFVPVVKTSSESVAETALRELPYAVERIAAGHDVNKGLYATKRGERPRIGVAGAACQVTRFQSTPVARSSRSR